MNHLKMYVCIKQSLPHHKVVAAAHGPLQAHLEFQNRPVYQEWLTASFRKVVCEVTDDQFETLKMIPDHIMVTEDTWDDKELALVFCPRESWPPEFRQFPLLMI